MDEDDLQLDDPTSNDPFFASDDDDDQHDTDGSVDDVTRLTQQQLLLK